MFEHLNSFFLFFAIEGVAISLQFLGVDIKHLLLLFSLFEHGAMLYFKF